VQLWSEPTLCEAARRRGSRRERTRGGGRDPHRAAGNHPFFFATLFLPQKRSALGQPHPVLCGFAAAVAGSATGREISGKVHAH
jgi:hypothetical protein